VGSSVAGKDRGGGRGGEGGGGVDGVVDGAKSLIKVESRRGYGQTPRISPIVSAKPLSSTRIERKMSKIRSIQLIYGVGIEGFIVGR